MNKDKLTALCHKIAKEKEVPFNVTMTYYFLEQILQKISASSYREQFIFKGGFLLSNMIGVTSRTTTDMDFIIQQLQMERDVLVAALEEILQDDRITYTIAKVTDIKDEDPYGGYRISVLCQLDNIRMTIPLDIATGDPITPKSVQYHYQSLFTTGHYPILAYNVETILAEKLETIYRRSFFNSRSKDFYDVYILSRLEADAIDVVKLKQACQNTFAYRHTPFDLIAFEQLLVELQESSTLQNHWTNYQKHYDYAKGIAFHEVLSACELLVRKIAVEL
ncbi:nucleotidyl transferase AbiEii/AbiGii toxin family protein [Lactococcus ileimucosae]|uniref:nucleotidyl transferase AbiEii/AbiGii toxin family protein n=1 Tax=Lactococcus ileimucosae TaxID=2941329 RepID=UPI003512C2DA